MQIEEDRSAAEMVLPCGRVMSVRTTSNSG